MSTLVQKRKTYLKTQRKYFVVMGYRIRNLKGGDEIEIGPFLRFSRL